MPALSCSKELVDEKLCHDAKSNQFDVAQCSVHASNHDATQNEADPGPATAVNARVVTEPVATSGPELGSSRPPQLGSARRMPNSSVPSVSARTVQMVDPADIPIQSRRSRRVLRRRSSSARLCFAGTVHAVGVAQICATYQG